MIVDSDNYAASGIETMFFPGGEPHVKIPNFVDQNILLFLKLRTWSDVGIAACLMDAMFSQTATHKTFIPYFPGARQDRTDGYSPLTARMMTRILPDRAFVFDIHSNKALRYSDNINLMPLDLDLGNQFKDVTGVIAPDKGAFERAHLFKHAHCRKSTTVVTCDKKRDFQSGKFLGFEMPLLEKAGRYLIVDDICDGGGTFNLFADSFKKDPFGKDSILELWVSHGIFSKGLNNIDPIISHIWTTDSFCQMTSNERLTNISLMNNMRRSIFR